MTERFTERMATNWPPDYTKVNGVSMCDYCIRRTSDTSCTSFHTIPDDILSGKAAHWKSRGTEPPFAPSRPAFAQLARNLWPDT